MRRIIIKRNQSLHKIYFNEEISRVKYFKNAHVIMFSFIIIIIIICACNFPTTEKEAAISLKRKIQ